MRKNWKIKWPNDYKSRENSRSEDEYIDTGSVSDDEDEKRPDHEDELMDSEVGNVEGLSDDEMDFNVEDEYMYLIQELDGP